MSIQHLLEDFGGGRRSASQSAAAPDEEELETRRLAAFEEGYRAGWDDAIAVHAKDKLRITSDLAQNLLDMSFTYNEAYTHLFRELRPLLREMVDKLLPQVMRRAIGPRIIEQLQTAAAENLGGDAHILVNPALVDLVETLVEQENSFPVSVRGEPGLAEGQAQLSLSDREIEINLDEMVAEISSAIDAFTHDLQKEDTYERQNVV